MFNSGIRGKQRCNGHLNSPSVDPLVSKKTHTHSHTNYKLAKLDKVQYINGKQMDKVRVRSPSSLSNTATQNSGAVVSQVTLNKEEDFEERVATHSIIDVSEMSQKYPVAVRARVKKNNVRATYHEALQRIEREKDVFNYYQQHWFSPSLEKFKLEDRSREERIEITRHEFIRHIQQLQRSNVGQRNKVPDWHVKLVNSALSDKHTHYQNNRVMAPKYCDVEECIRAALPCTKYCAIHIMMDTEQVLFEYCTAKFSDNTQCSVPVFDIMHELPLCAEHARKRDNYKLYQEAKPKKIRKKVKPSAMIRPQKRNKKKKKPTKPSEVANNTSGGNEGAQSAEMITEIEEADSPELEEDLEIVDQVLALNENGLEQALVQQAHLLEETDISNVLSTIQVDEFSDFFAVNRNGEYEPSREEAEELEKALAAVDNDVKSLEKLSQSQGLLESLLDENALAETLVQIPEMFHNGYTPCGDSMVAQTPSYLLPIEPHSHS